MRRLAILPSAALVLVVGAACGAPDPSAIETLPPIRTTSTIATTSTTINTDRIFYTVKRGDNLNLIASSFEVPLQALIDLNRSVVSDPDNVPAGVTLEIPTGIQLVDELPTPESTEEP